MDKQDIVFIGIIIGLVCLSIWTFKQMSNVDYNSVSCELLKSGRHIAETHNCN